uniref:Uncharacterized protein n=1 Tax=Meloidogyne enterolobii TaxID=390850 RepID=A0A6V7VNH1_MELEN|nr:unnamed protein product [Meloidogyne enterolobii]
MRVFKTVDNLFFQIQTPEKQKHYGRNSLIFWVKNSNMLVWMIQKNEISNNFVDKWKEANCCAVGGVVQWITHKLKERNSYSPAALLKGGRLISWIPRIIQEDSAGYGYGAGSGPVEIEYNFENKLKLN